MSFLKQNVCNIKQYKKQLYFFSDITRVPSKKVPNIETTGRRMFHTLLLLCRSYNRSRVEIQSVI